MEKIIISLPKNNNCFSVSLAGITYPTPDYLIIRPKSSLCVIEYIVSGKGTVFCDDNEYCVKKGDVYILPQSKKHRYFSSADDPWEKKWINITGTLSSALLQAYGISEIIHFPSCNIENLFDEFFDFCEKNTDIDKINNFAAIIFHRMVQFISSNTVHIENETASKIKNFINSNIYEKLSVKELAYNNGISVSQLGRIFKAEYGTTVYSYILDRKIETAENLLRNTALSVKEISYLLHFTDEHYFSNIFKAKKNITPGECRKRKKPL